MARSFLGWPVLRQLRGHDPLGRGPAVRSPKTDAITPRIATADRVDHPISLYAATKRADELLTEPTPVQVVPPSVVFQTPPLAEDVEVTGPIDVRLWVSSDCPDTDFTAKLIDVYPDEVADARTERATATAKRAPARRRGAGGEANGHRRLARRRPPARVRARRPDRSGPA